MQTTVSAVDVTPAKESTVPAVSWGPVVAGAVTAAAVTLLLLVLGSGLGLTMISPWSSEGVTITTFAASTAIWLVVVQWLSAALGGYLTGRLRTRWVGVHTDEVYFRDTAHGFLAWALATLLMAAVLGSTLSSMVSGGAQAVTGVAAGAAMGAAANVDEESAGGATSYFVDTLFRPAQGAAPATGAGDNAAATQEASRILLQSATGGEVSADDRTYLAQLIATRTGLSQADAAARVDATIARIEEAKTEALAAADTARKASAVAALVTALALLVGAFIASAGAAFGGRQRDDEEVLYLTRR